MVVKKQPIRVARRLFAEEPRILRVEANVEDDLWARVGVDFTFVVDVGPHEVDFDIARLVARFMVEADVGAQFMVLPESESEESHGVLVYAREQLAGTA